MKKLYMFIIVFFFPLFAAGEQQLYEYQNFIYSILPNDTITIESCNSTETEIEIPSHIRNQSVSAISAGAFGNCTNLEKIIIPDSITEIGYNPFWKCASLKKIIVSPDNPYFAVIDDVLFQKTNKRLICYPANKTNPSYAVPNGIISIDVYAFYECQTLQTITLPNSITSLNHYSFILCTNLRSINLPSSIEFIGYNPFYGCTSLYDISIPQSNPYYCTLDGVLYNKSTNTLISYPAGRKHTKYQVESLAERIGEYAFFNCTALESVHLPDGLREISTGAFYFCSNLCSIYLPASISAIDHTAFLEIEDVTLIVTPDSFARQFAINNNYPYTYPDSLSWLTN